MKQQQNLSSISPELANLVLLVGWWNESLAMFESLVPVEGITPVEGQATPRVLARVHLLTRPPGPSPPA